jgi:acyl-coenzyme A thioesterase PaaI-like protein
MNELLPFRSDNASMALSRLFAPWVQQLGLCDFDISPGRARARLPQSAEMNLYAGPMCGQAIMAAVDTVVVLAVGSHDRLPKATIYQHTHFLRPALHVDVWIEAVVQRVGKNSAFITASATSATSGDLLAQCSSEFAV